MRLKNVFRILDLAKLPGTPEISDLIIVNEAKSSRAEEEREGARMELCA